MKRERTNILIFAMLAAGIGTASYAGLHSHALHPVYALALLAMAAATSRMNIKLPGIDGSMSVNLPFLLMGVVNLSALEAVLIAGVSTVAQCWPKPDGKWKPGRMLFNLGMMAFATSVANLIWNAAWLGKSVWVPEPLLLALATSAFFFGQTLPVAGMIKVAEGASMRRTWLNIAQLSFPYFVLSAGLTSMTNLVSHRFGWQTALVAFLVMYGVHRSYRLYFRAAEALRAAPLAKAAAAFA